MHIVKRVRTMETTMRANPEQCWAIGYEVRGMFYVRRIVWGRLLARHECRPGEKYRRAVVFITG